MCLYDLVSRNACFAFKAVNILCEQLEETPFLVEETDEGMGDGRTIFAWI